MNLMKKVLSEKKIIPGCEEIRYGGGQIGCLLIHGFKSCPHEMKDMGKYLNNLGFTVIITLLPGHGTSPQHLKETKWTEWFDSVKHSFFELRKKCKNVFVAGLSTGASLALHLAAHYEVDGVIALAPGLYLKQKSAKLAHILKYVWKYRNDQTGPDVSVKVKTLSYDKIPLNAVSELLKFFDHLYADLKEVFAPVLIIYSEKDHVIKPKSALTIYNSISSKNKRILKLEKSYHIITLDVEKEIVFSETSDFIKQILK